MAQLQALVLVSHLRGCHSVMFLLVFGIEMAGFFDWVSGKFDACKCLKTVYPKGPAPDSQLCSVPLPDECPTRAAAVREQCMAKFLYRGIFYTVMGALVLVLSWTDVIAVRSRVLLASQPRRSLALDLRRTVASVPATGSAPWS